MLKSIILGLQWGDEGKGKVVDYLVEQDKYDIVVRFQGGNNAGHTVVVGDTTFKLHLLPSGIIQGKVCVLGNGMVIDADVLLQELQNLPQWPADGTLLISKKAHVITFYNCMLDQLKEIAQGAEKIGTTGRGIGPTYGAKIHRNGLRMHHLLDADLKNKLADNIKDVILYLRVKVGEEAVRQYIRQHHLDFYHEVKIIDIDKVVAHYAALGEKFRPYLTDVSLFLRQALDDGKKILWEGAQGIMLDVDHGTYPFLTSSNTVIGNALTGSGVYTHIDNRIGIVKAYTTRVGAGPFPTELHDNIGTHLQEQGHEFGTTTGRRRRCGWIDLVQLQYATMLNAINKIALTKLDVLSGLEKIKICVGYKNGMKETTHFPCELSVLEQCTPIFEEMPGWQEDITQVKKFEDLPEATKNYVKRIEQIAPIVYISVGPERSQTILRTN